MIDNKISSTAKIYRNVDIRNSTVGCNSSIGDETVLLKASISDCVQLIGGIK